MIHIKVPSTSANMGSGFDSIGVALNMYNHIWIEEIENDFEICIKTKQSIDIPTDKSNLIYKTISDFYEEIGMTIPNIRIIQKDSIPIARGLGSSAACVVAGIMAANYMSGCNYSKYELAEIAAKIEKHPDNSNPAILGGIVVSTTYDYGMKYEKISTAKNIKFVAMIPDFAVSTQYARSVLPDNIPLKDAVFNSSRTALLVASIINGNIDNLKIAMQDRIHQPYRKHIIPNMDIILEKANKCGAVGSYLSGAGSTLMAVVTDDNSDIFKEEMEKFLLSMPNKWDINILDIDNCGATIILE